MRRWRCRGRISPDLQTKLATGWMHTYDGRRFEAPTFLLGTGPAGNLYCSVDDLANFLIWLLNDGDYGAQPILQAQTLALMTTPIQDQAGGSQGFGFGFHIQELDGHRKVGHGGAVYGFSTQLEALPDRRLGVVAAAALDGSNGVVGRLADYALRLMRAQQDKKPLPDYIKTVPISSARAQRLAKMYLSFRTMVCTMAKAWRHGPPALVPRLAEVPNW